MCNLDDPFTGEVSLSESDAVIKSVELQLVRVETCGCADGYAKEGIYDIISVFAVVVWIIYNKNHCGK